MFKTLGAVGGAVGGAVSATVNVIPGVSGGGSSRDDDGERSQSSRRKKKKKKHKKKHKEESYEGGDPSQREQRRKSIKKMRMRLWGRRKKKDGDGNGAEGNHYDPNVQSGRAGSVAVYERSSSYNQQGNHSADSGGFQLDNVMPSASMSGTSSSYHQNYGSGGPPAQGKRIEANPREDMNKKFRARPFHSFPAPTYMNEVELYQCMMAPSSEIEFLTSYLNPSTKSTRRAKVPEIVQQHFGSPKEDGRIGSLRVEILGCVGLDRTKPDVSVYTVCGDCAFSTDIIQGARSSMWPNSSKRAAVFPLHHAYARLFVGVFDVKQRKNSEADHFCGRVAIDIPALRPNTEYDITFPLRVSSFIYDRRPRGVVRIRFSLHWFSERAAILSYLKRPRNPLAFSKQAKKQPTIPCGDPKTFRNVAVTVHGQDFPGKYTRGAFRATMREFNLSQQNIRFLMKVLILDCILYENPMMSLYLFVSTMYCVYQNSVRLVPPLFVGWIIYLFVENQIYFNGSPAGTLGYQALTIKEVFYALIRDGKHRKANFGPILVKKRARRQVIGEDGKLIDIELQNHREFPFSERFEYPKFAAADAIAPSPSAKNKKGDKGTCCGRNECDKKYCQFICIMFAQVYALILKSFLIEFAAGSTDLRTARRLSIYVSPVEQQEGAPEESEVESDDESMEGENEGEGMMDEDDEEGYGKMDDSDEEESDDEEETGGAPRKKKKQGRLFEAGQASKTRRIRVGPPQNSDKSGRKLPPQAHLSRVELMLHRATKNISVEHVHFPPPHVQSKLGKEVNAKGPAGDVLTAKEKQHFDEFDKVLGYRTKNPNPIVRITSSFLGPLMRIIRIVIYAVRISFNICSWRDPYLSFWIFAFLCVLAFVLLIFPWRTFCFLASLVLLGPQNIAVRKYLERRAKEREVEEKEQKEKDDLNAQLKTIALDPTQQSKQSVTVDKDDKNNDDKGKKKRRWGRNRKKDAEDEQEEEINEADLYQSPRPAFYAHTRPTRKAQVPRDVAVPYFRFRKDRFFDWPPDPTVSRATPMLTCAQAQATEADGEDDDRRGGSGDEFDDESKQYDGRGNQSQIGHQYSSINDLGGLRNRNRAYQGRRS